MRAEARVGRQVRQEPFLLRRVRLAAADEVAFGVEADDVPVAQVEAVVGRKAEVLEVAGRILGQILVVADRREGDRPCTCPTSVVDVEIRLVAVVLVLGVAERQDGVGRSSPSRSAVAA